MKTLIFSFAFGLAVAAPGASAQADEGAPPASAVFTVPGTARYEGEPVPTEPDPGVASDPEPQSAPDLASAAAAPPPPSSDTPPAPEPVAAAAPPALPEPAQPLLLAPEVTAAAPPPVPELEATTAPLPIPEVVPPSPIGAIAAIAPTVTPLPDVVAPSLPDPLPAAPVSVDGLLATPLPTSGGLL